MSDFGNETKKSSWEVSYAAVVKLNMFLESIYWEMIMIIIVWCKIICLFGLRVKMAVVNLISFMLGEL